MPWSMDNVPSVAKKWTPEEQHKCVMAANATLKDTGDDAKAIYACINAAGKSKEAKMSIDFATGETVTAEIFAVGTWNKQWKFSTQDLQDIAANFNALAENHKVPLKFGHNDQQPITDGQPALGWVTKVWVEGNKLKAQFDNVPKIVKAAFDAKMYRHVSVELDVDVEHKGKKYKYVLSAVALLGADIPAVNTLADLSHYLDGGSRLAASRRMVFSTIAGDLCKPTEDNDMTKEELDAALAAALAPLKADVAKFSAENATLKAENEAMKQAEKIRAETEAKAKVKMHRETLIGKLETAVKEKRLTPAQRESAIKFMRLNDEKDAMNVTAESIDEYINVNGGKATFSKETGRGAGTGDGNGSNYTDADAEIVARAKKLQAEDSKLSFSAARNRVMEGDPELARKWLNDEEAA